MNISLGMGAWRLFLALGVVATHLWVRTPYGLGPYAVFGFFVLSGFLMTMVLSTKYGFEADGVRRYAINRIVRIFPAYYIALLLGVVLVGLGASQLDTLRQINPAFGVPTGWGWLNPLTLLTVFPIETLPVGVSNALAIEVTAYALMPLIAYSKRTAFIAAAISILLTQSLGFGTGSFVVRYATFVPCLMCFAAGAILWHYYEDLKAIRMPALSISVWVAHVLVWYVAPDYPFTYGLYVSIALSAWVTVSLFEVKTGWLDKLLGDLSYPMYLLHSISAGAIILAFGYEGKSLKLSLATVALTSIVSLCIVMWVERPLQALKRPPRARVTQHVAVAVQTPAE